MTESSTTILRRMLDERGVEWQAPTSFDGTARYDTVAGGYWFHEFNGKITIHGLDPAQAIAATLGATDAKPTQVESSGTCEADEMDLIPFVRADSDDFKVDYIHVMECTECGHTYEHVNGDYEYCPRCGRKRRDVEE